MPNRFPVSAAVPTLALLDRRCGRRASPLSSAAREIKRGAIVAVKGLGGYHLACLARSPQAIRKLRRRKKRESKPFALMGTLGMIEACCQVSPAERELLQVPAAPIVLLKKRRGARLPSLIARGLNRVGFLLPYTPLHQLLVQKVGEPLVMTSANLSDDPILFSDEDDALKEFADFILTHDRPIQAFCDDSLVQADDKGQVHFLRRSRGYVPLPLDASPLPARASSWVLADCSRPPSHF